MTNPVQFCRLCGGTTPRYRCSLHHLNRVQECSTRDLITASEEADRRTHSTFFSLYLAGMGGKTVQSANSSRVVFSEKVWEHAQCDDGTYEVGCVLLKEKRGKNQAWDRGCTNAAFDRQDSLHSRWLVVTKACPLLPAASLSFDPSWSSLDCDAFRSEYAGEAARIRHTATYQERLRTLTQRRQQRLRVKRLRRQLKTCRL